MPTCLFKFKTACYIKNSLSSLPVFSMKVQNFEPILIPPGSKTDTTYYYQCKFCEFIFLNLHSQKFISPQTSEVGNQTNGGLCFYHGNGECYPNLQHSAQNGRLDKNPLIRPTAAKLPSRKSNQRADTWIRPYFQLSFNGCRTSLFSDAARFL